MPTMRAALLAMKPYTPGVLIPGKIKLASNENPLGPSPLAMKAYADTITRLHQYPDAGITHLRDALSTHFNLPANHFSIGNGLDEVLVTIAAAFIETGSKVIVGKHTFSEYRFASNLLGAEVIAVPMPNLLFDVDAILSAVDKNTSAIFLCSPNNPTGSLVPRKDLERLLTKVPQSTLVVIDAAYSEFVDDPEELGYPFEKQLLARFSNVLLLHTFSKIYGLAGLRIGYAMGEPKLIEALERARSPFNVNLAAQEAGVAALGDFEFVQRSKQNNHDQKLVLYKAFTALGLEYLPTQSNFICIETHRDAMAVFRAISDGGVTIRPLVSFGLNTSIRVSIGTPEQNQVFLKALEKALQVVPVIV